MHFKNVNISTYTHCVHMLAVCGPGFVQRGCTYIHACAQRELSNCKLSMSVNTCMNVQHELEILMMKVLVPH